MAATKREKTLTEPAQNHDLHADETLGHRGAVSQTECLETRAGAQDPPQSTAKAADHPAQPGLGDGDPTARGFIALARRGKPESFYTDQGGQFTPTGVIKGLAGREIKSSIDGKDSERRSKSLPR